MLSENQDNVIKSNSRDVEKVVLVKLDDGSEEVYLHFLKKDDSKTGPLCSKIIKDDAVTLMNKTDGCNSKMGIQRKVLENTSKLMRTNETRVPYKRSIFDKRTIIPPREFKQQLQDTSDIITKQEFAAMTKEKMKRISTTGINKIFANPGHINFASSLIKYYTRHCVSDPQPNVESYDDMPLLPIGYQAAVDHSSIKRITRKRKYPEAEAYKKKLQEAQNNSVKIAIDERRTDVRFLVNNINEKCDPLEELFIIKEEDQNCIVENGDDVIILQSVDGENVMVYKSVVINVMTS